MLDQLLNPPIPPHSPAPAGPTNALSPVRHGIPLGRTTLSPPALEARRDLLRVNDLILQGKRQCDIAAIMGKDAAWVSRTIRRIQRDPALIYSPPNAQTIVSEQLARLEALIRMALEHAGASEGATKTGALRLAADLQEKRTAFLEKVGILRPVLPSGQMEMSPGDAFLQSLRQDFSVRSLTQMLQELKDIQDSNANGPAFPNRDDYLGATPFLERINPTRFARARPRPTS